MYVYAETYNSLKVRERVSGDYHWIPNCVEKPLIAKYSDSLTAHEKYYQEITDSKRNKDISWGALLKLNTLAKSHAVKDLPTPAYETVSEIGLPVLVLKVLRNNQTDDWDHEENDLYNLARIEIAILNGYFDCNGRIAEAGMPEKIEVIKRVRIPAYADDGTPFLHPDNGPSRC